MDEVRFVFDERFIEAFVSRPEGHHVMGRRLRPFSTWHLLQLQYVQNPLVTGGAVAAGDMDLATRICQTQFPESVRPKRRWWTWRAIRVQSAVAAFEAYVADYASGPDIQAEQTKTQSARLPDMDSLLQELALYRKMSGCSREEAWNVPIGEMAWMNAAWARMEGAKFSIMTELERAALRRAKAKLTEAK
jgi:hypothetical protein